MTTAPSKTPYETITPIAYFEMLKSHDWKYYDSYDPAQKITGRMEDDRLRKLAKLSPLFDKIHSAFAAYYYDVVEINAYPKLEDFGLDSVITNAMGTIGVVQQFDDYIRIYTNNQWAGLYDLSRVILKRNSLPFDFDILQMTDAELDNYVQRRAGNFAQLTHDMAKLKVADDNITVEMYNRKFQCREGVYSTTGPDGKPLVFRSLQQMVCWILKVYW